MIIVDVVMMLRDLIFRFAAFDVLSSGRSHEQTYYIVRNTRLPAPLCTVYGVKNVKRTKLAEIVSSKCPINPN